MTLTRLKINIREKVLGLTKMVRVGLTPTAIGRIAPSTT